jgi:hypothetical protein
MLSVVSKLMPKCKISVTLDSPGLWNGTTGPIDCKLNVNIVNGVDDTVAKGCVVVLANIVVHSTATGHCVARAIRTSVLQSPHSRHEDIFNFDREIVISSITTLLDSLLIVARKFAIAIAFIRLDLHVMTKTMPGTMPSAFINTLETIVIESSREFFHHQAVGSRSVLHFV